jgi:hypothetical protein
MKLRRVISTPASPQFWVETQTSKKASRLGESVLVNNRPVSFLVRQPAEVQPFIISVKII